MSDLQNDLQTIADRHASQSGGDFDTVLRTATTRRRRRFAGVSAVACAVLAVGGIAAVSPWQHDPADVPVAAGPTLDPKYAGTMTITPSTAAPDAEIRLTFPADNGRGVGFSLADPSDETKALYYLTAPRSPNGKPFWKSAADNQGGGWRAIGISGPGPDRLVVPTTIADGTYLLCTEMSNPKACALLTVAR
ncbi:hypothetical protein AB0P21_14350 [Kribbella sp. NPDC056861]|uniref:hypothetical protein n=1 Tax=Kribbella sp. NPDC056861 TaxID=3154857 RepID=UPI0034372447